MVPKSYAWRQVYVNEANEVVETSEEVDWDPEELEGKCTALVHGFRDNPNAPHV